MKYTLRPISDRTAFTGQHEYSPFRATWADTLQILGRELDAINGRDVVLEIDLTEGDLRLDGLPRANAKVATPAVRIAFESEHGPLTYATDRYVARYRGEQDWHPNVRAIALGLESLRKVDRYGITKRGEQYAGFKALPAGTAMPASHMTSDQAFDVLVAVVGPAEVDWEDDAALLKAARAAAHPDRHRGDHTLAYEVDQAARVLGLVR